MALAMRVIRMRGPVSRQRRLACSAIPTNEKKVASPARMWGKNVSRTTEDKLETATDEGPEKGGWDLLDLNRMNEKWDAPWGVGRMLLGMLLWVVSFAGVGFVLVPALYSQAGVDIFKLDAADKTTFTLVSQVAETVVTLALIRLLTVQSLDAAPEVQGDFFNYSLSGPFKSPNGWAAWAILGVFLAPLVVGATAGLLSVVGYENVGGRGTVDGVVQMISMDSRSYLNLIAVTGVLAPLLEETLFRGFILTSLTRFMPTPLAIPLSSLFFAAAHLSARDFPVLFSIGCLLGITYVRSKNLLTPIIIHGCWNSTVLSMLFVLSASGIDIEEMLKNVQ
jgi:membrane protease YdiL (CAAX protease family)